MSRRFIVSEKQKLGLTHFLRIPIATTSASRTQILEPYRLIQCDPLAASIPVGAFRPIDDFHLYIGALRLPNHESLHDATVLLQILERNCWRSRFRDNAVLSEWASTYGSNQSFSVDLVGLGDSIRTHSIRDLTNTMFLFTYIKELSGSLQQFVRCVRSIFRSADFHIPDSREDERTPLLQFTVVDTSRVNSDVQTPYNHPLRPKFNGAALHKKYKDVHWAKNLQLQELRITKIGRSRSPDGQPQGFVDVTAASLPGIRKSHTSDSLLHSL